MFDWFFVEKRLTEKFEKMSNEKEAPPKMSCRKKILANFGKNFGKNFFLKKILGFLGRQKNFHQ